MLLAGVQPWLELCDLYLLIFKPLSLLLDQVIVRPKHHVACGEIVRQHDFLRHARNIMTPSAKRKCFF